ncbi:hypothetical protein SBA3_250024 [Candidatus Sulfopaludibacter sp. SbA3]|nr:hypothetical protein SBA3_250024 [Candidatus Sulfopaludibacter sp. SbA3]
MTDKRSGKGERPFPKAVLRLPDLDQAKSAMTANRKLRGYQSGQMPADAEVFMSDRVTQRAMIAAPGLALVGFWPAASGTWKRCWRGAPATRWRWQARLRWPSR